MEMSKVRGCLGFEVTVVEFFKSIGGVGINEEIKCPLSFEILSLSIDAYRLLRK